MASMWQFEAVGLPALKGELDTWAADLADTEAVLHHIAPEAGESIRQNFEQGGRPQPWPDITAKSRSQRKVNKTSGPLIDSGALEEAASASTSGVEGSVFAINGNTATFGTDYVFAAVHQFGWPEKNIPARPYEDIVPEDQLKLARSTSDYLLEMLSL